MDAFFDRMHRVGPAASENGSGGTLEAAMEATEEGVRSPTHSPSPPPAPRTPPKKVYNRKIAIMGYSAVGKSAITARFLNGAFPEQNELPIELMHEKTFEYRGREYALKLLDTAGQQEFFLLPRSCAVDVDGFILVYALDHRDSFNVIKSLHDKILEGVDRNFPVLIVGNKLDLHKYRQVSREEGEALAASCNAAFMEISARELWQSQSPSSPPTAHGHMKKMGTINELFEKLIRTIEIAKGNMNADGRFLSGPGSEGSRCGTM